MDEKQLKTSPWQRVVIIVVALLLLGSTVLTYMFIVMSGNSSKQSQEERVAELEAEWTAKNAELDEAVKPLSDKYFKDMQGYKASQVKSYNAVTANNEKLKTEDLKIGTGKELKEGDSEYSAYYIGWCADGSIFDSSFAYPKKESEDGQVTYDKDADPTGLNAPLINPSSLIEGWQQGVIGMKLGGVRQLSIPGELAYGDTRSDICGQSDAPLKFVVMAIETDDNVAKLNDELNDIWIKLYTALAGSASSNK